MRPAEVFKPRKSILRWLPNVCVSSQPARREHELDDQRRIGKARPHLRSRLLIDRCSIRAVARVVFVLVPAEIFEFGDEEAPGWKLPDDISDREIKIGVEFLDFSIQQFATILSSDIILIVAKRKS